MWISFVAQIDRPLVRGWVFDRLGIHPSVIANLIYGIVLAAVIFAPLVSLVAMLFIWWERKAAGRIQSRPGPNRVGPIGLFQSAADGIKLVLKEDLIPDKADRTLFRLAPYLAFVPVFVAFMALPFAPDFTFEPRLDAGVFWILAVLSVEVMGVILAGWASNNKWSIYGAMREACQMVSYEIPLGISIIVAIMAAGTLNLVQLGLIQGGGIWTWLVFQNPFVFMAFGAYFVASLASNKRAPFDLPESESELVAGFHTEYSGIRFSFFFFAEYAAMFIIACLQTALFLGAWHDPFGIVGYWHAKWMADPRANGLALFGLNCVGAAIFLSKALVIVFVQMWIRWTLPRPRIDQVLYACIKVLLPFACALLLGAAIWQLLIPNVPGVPWVDYDPMSWSVYQANGAQLGLVVQSLLAAIGVGLVLMVVGWVSYAFVTGRNLKQRLTDPDPIPDPKAVAAS